jgi:hypothetical protein
MSEQPYRSFATEEAYRDHIAEIVGPRIGREQAKTEQAEEERDELLERVEELERALAECRRAADGTGTPLYPTNTPLRSTDPLGSVLCDLDRSRESDDDVV